MKPMQRKEIKEKLKTVEDKYLMNVGHVEMYVEGGKICGQNGVIKKGIVPVANLIAQAQQITLRQAMWHVEQACKIALREVSK
jgi:ribosomal protein S9